MYPKMIGAAVVVGAVILGGGLLVGGLSPLSLATDVGLTDDEVCAAVERDAAQAVQRLEASGFPHASTSSVEVYRLTRDATTEAIVQIDWANQRAACLPLEYDGPVTASVDMTDGAYGIVVGELRHVLAQGTLSGHPGNLLYAWWGTEIHLPSNEAYEGGYEWAIAKWSAGFLAREVAR